MDIREMKFGRGLGGDAGLATGARGATPQPVATPVRQRDAQIVRKGGSGSRKNKASGQLEPDASRDKRARAAASTFPSSDWRTQVGRCLDHQPGRATQWLQRLFTVPAPYLQADVDCLRSLPVSVLDTTGARDSWRARRCCSNPCRPRRRRTCGWPWKPLLALWSQMIAERA